MSWKLLRYFLSALLLVSFGAVKTKAQFHYCPNTNTWVSGGCPAGVATSLDTSAGITGAVVTANNGSNATANVVGLSLGNGGAVVSGTSYTVLCDTATSTRDRATMLEFTSATAVAVTLPDPSTSGCGNGFIYKMHIKGAGTVTTTRGTSATIDIYNGSVTSAATSFSLTTGQSAVVYSPDNTNWRVDKVTGVTLSVAFTDLAPVVGDDGLVLVINPSTPIHLTRISCGVQGSTSVVVNLVKAAVSLIADATCTAGDVNTVAVTTWANGSGQCGGTTSCAIPARAPVILHIGTISGSPTALQGSLEYTVD